MDRYTYRDLIRKYSKDVESGTFDKDLTPLQRRLTARMLNLASNANDASVFYPPSDKDREDVAKTLPGWEARSLLEVVNNKAGDDFDIARDRARDILRGI